MLDWRVSRETVEAWLDDVVGRNRFTIAVLFPLVGALLLAGSAMGVVPPPLRFNPLLILGGTLVMRLPLVAGLLPVLDRKGSLGILAVTGYAYAIEYVGATTGVPYGRFSYGIDLGPMLGPVPLGLPLFFVPLLLNSYLLYLLLQDDGGFRMWVAVAAVLVGLDLVLDPAAVSLGFWSYEVAGPYHGVPLSNFAGWMLSAAVTTAILVVALPTARVRDRLLSTPYMLDDMVSFVLLWGGINLVFGNLVPALLAGVVLLLLARSGRFDTELLGRVSA